MLNIVRQPLDTLIKNKLNKSQTDFIFCYDRDSYGGMVMLSSHQHILQQLITDAEDPHFFWVLKREHCKFDNQLKQIEERSYFFMSLEQMLNFARSQEQIKKVILICCCQEEQVLIFIRNPLFIGVIIYQQSNPIQENQQFLIEQEEEKVQISISQKLIKCNSPGSLQNALLSNRWLLSQSKQFPNFVSLKQQVHKSKMLVWTMKSVISDSISQSTRGQIIDELISVINKLQKFHPKFHRRHILINQALNQLKLGHLRKQRAISIYTSQKYNFFVLINSFLRAMSHPTQIFYVQPFLYDFFFIIRNIYQETDTIQFECFRGGSTIKKQMEQLSKAVGQHIQNLGFLSTSLSAEVARSFKQNIIYEIRVPNLNRNDKSKSSGFGNVSCESQYISEQQVLFNTLNYFKVLEIKTKNYHPNELAAEIEYYVILSFVEVAEILNHSGQQVTESERIAKEMIASHQQMISGYKYQSNAIMAVKNKQNLQTAYIFWQFYLPVIQKFISAGNQSLSQSQQLLSTQPKMSLAQQFYQNALREVGSLIYLYGKYEQALIFFYQSEQFQRLHQCTANLNYARTLKCIASCLCILHKYENAFYWFSKCKEVEKEILGERNPVYLETLSTIGAVLLQIGSSETSLQALRQCQRLQKQIVGEWNTNYLFTLKRIGSCLHKQHRYEEALNIFQKSEKTIRIIFGEYDQHYSNILMSKAMTLRGLKRNEEALQLFNKSEQIWRSFGGQKHPFFLNIQFQKGQFLQSCRKYDQSLSIYTKLKQQTKQLMGESNPISLMILKQIIVCLLMLKNYKEALQICARCEKIIQVIWEQSNLKSLKNFYDLGRVFLICNRHSQALPMFQKCHRIQIKTKQQKSQQYFTNLWLMVNCQAVLGQFQQFVACLAKFGNTAKIYKYYSYSTKILFNIKRFAESLYLTKQFIKHAKNQRLLSLQIDINYMHKLENGRIISRITETKLQQQRQKERISIDFISLH